MAEHEIPIILAGLAAAFACGEVEELLLPGPPLGTMTGFDYRQQRVELASGDVVLLASDGLPEVAGLGGDALGYAAPASLSVRRRPCRLARRWRGSSRRLRSSPAAIPWRTT
jgi:serine phosphatase RsbU (regulator of sigma subunit)